METMHVTFDSPDGLDVKPFRFDAKSVAAARKELRRLGWRFSHMGDDDVTAVFAHKDWRTEPRLLHLFLQDL